MTKNYNTAKATDILVSLANKLPENLLVDSVNDKGKFSLNFLLRLTDNQLVSLKEEASKKKSDFLLDFATIELESDTCPNELRNFSDFNWEKVYEIKISGDTCPYQPNIHSKCVDYVCVTFVLKNE